MRTTQAIKRENLQMVIDTYYNGTRRKLEIALGKKDGALSRYFSTSDSAREIGRKLCGQVETLHNLPPGWMSADHSSGNVKATPEELLLIERYRASNQVQRLRAIQELQRESPPEPE